MTTSVKAKVTQLGLDCHRNFSNVTSRDAAGRVVWRQRLAHQDRGAFRSAIRAWPAGLPVVLESTFGWGWVCDEMREAGHEPHLASSTKVAGWREARGLSKSNRTDADLLSELWGSQQSPRWWEVWLPPQAVRDERELLRHRLSMVLEQTRLKNRIHATLHRHGLVLSGLGLSDLFGREGKAMLQALSKGEEVTVTVVAASEKPAKSATGTVPAKSAKPVTNAKSAKSATPAAGATPATSAVPATSTTPAASTSATSVTTLVIPPLRESARLVLRDDLHLLEELRQRIAAATRLCRAAVSRSVQGERWRSLPGVSWVLAYTILAEVGDVARFANARHLSSYALLAPRACDSGDARPADEPPRGRRVGKAGRLTLKWAFIQAAHGAVRKSEVFRALFERRTDGGKRDRGRGYIAVAHELCRIGFSCCRHDRPYSDQPPARPGSAAAVAAGPAAGGGGAPAVAAVAPDVVVAAVRGKRKKRSGPLVRERAGPDRPLAVAHPEHRASP